MPKMVYFCTKCGMTHADKYYRHLKYKRNPEDVGLKEEPKDELDYIKREIKHIKQILDEWSYYMERKHPYFRRTEEFIRWIEQ